MNLFDLAALIVLVAAVIAGARTGALPQIGGIAGAVGGLVLMLNLAPWLVERTGGLEPIPRVLVVLGAIIAAVLLGEALGSGLGREVADRLGDGMVSGMDRGAGGLLGGAQAVLIVWLIGGLLAVGPFPEVGRTASASFSMAVINAYLPPPTKVVGQIAGALDASGLPSVFVGLEPAPLAPVDLPGSAEARKIAGSATESTARVISLACSTQVTGTAEIISPGYLVTNAHVIAGAASIRLQLGSTDVEATPVVFNPDLDIALLHAAALQGPSLRFATQTPDRNLQGAAIGFPNGGPMAVIPAGVAGSYPATGRDIYNKGVIDRTIIELRAKIQPGDSGGPLILPDGTIGGIVFAESRTDPSVGYALSPTAVWNAVRAAIGRSAAVDTGPCIH
ncbi:MAG: MarP family serine protease [Chloroflexota bacterium]